MTIAAHNIPAYFRHLVFPVNVLAETGGAVAIVAYEQDLLSLVEINAVVAKGSWKTIKNIRLARPLAESIELRTRTGGSTPALSSAYREDGPTWLLKEAVGDRERFRLRKWDGA